MDTPGLDVDEVQALIIQHLEGLDGVEVHGHVGVSFIENVFSCVAKVIGKRVSQNGSRSIIINDGIFNRYVPHTVWKFQDFSVIRRFYVKLIFGGCKSSKNH